MNKLRAIRLQRGLSAQGLAIKAKASTGTVTGIERWGLVPTMTTCQRFAQALGVQVVDIWPNMDEAVQSHAGKAIGERHAQT